jgi:predicted exporter
MTPVRIALALAVLLGMLVATFLEVETDARSLLGDDDRVTTALDTPEGRSLTLAIIDPDRDKRTLLALQIAADLSVHPMVHRVTTVPGAPSSEVLGWLWRHRFVLAPPAKAAFMPDSLVSEMRRARAALVSASGGALADRYLHDPTGSFRRIVTTLTEASEMMLPVHDTVPQARDDSAALIFIELRAAPFEVATQAAFDTDLRQQVRAGGADALLIGPRAISAEISNRINKRTKLVVTIASALLLLWLVFVLHPASAALICLLPPALGFGAATVLVQVVFGSIHVITLGFGGALMGLALDYPLHLLAHRSEPEQIGRARRYVAMGAATTAIAFLALLGSGIPAIEQVGLFGASGLIIAAIFAAWLASGNHTAGLRSFASFKRPLIIPHKLPALVALTLACAVFLWQLPGGGPQRLVEVPTQIVDSIKRLYKMVELPSGRYRIEVTGRTLAEILAHQAHLSSSLQTAQRDGLVARFEMLGSHLPERRATSGLPSPETLSDTLTGLLAKAGLSPNFKEEIIAAYRAARDIPPAGPDALRSLGTLQTTFSLIRVDGDVLRAPVWLWPGPRWDAAAPDRLAKAVAQDGIEFIDQEKSIAGGLNELRSRVTLWLAVGAMMGIFFLSLAVRRPSAVAEIALGCLSAGLLTALLASVLTGGLGVFHVVALTLVVGIGIDYGIFLTLSENYLQYAAAMRSVLLCAATTLIAFLTMAVSGVSVLEDVGMTVSIGVIAMVGINLVRRTIAWTVEDR